LLKAVLAGGCLDYMPVIQVTQEEEIRKNVIPSQPWANGSKTHTLKIPRTKKG
jgi:hypothetical protein